MKYILALTTALVALVAAAPAPRNFITLDSIEAALKHHSVAGQPISSRDLPVDLVNGVCGGSTGYGCQTGYCCSEWGYCGNDANYCGVGCQFGACLQGGAAASPSPVAATIIGPASSVVQASSTTDESAPTTTAAGNKAGGPGGFGPGGAPTWSAPAWSAPAQPTTFATVTSAASTQSAPSQPTTTAAPAPTSTPAASSGSSSGWTFPQNSWAAQLSGWTSGGPAWLTGSSTSGAGLGDKYTFYKGDGTPSNGWPSQDQWVGSFETMWEANSAIMECSSQWPGATNNSPEETADIKAAILSVAAATGVDARFILAIIMQESKGCVRVWTTVGSVANPGLMQDYKGTASCNTNSAGVSNGQVQTPCPMTEIGGMVYQGTVGGAPDSDDNGHTHGLIDALNTAARTDISRFYRAAKLYNSGFYSLLSSNELSISSSATACYASDVANRLTGWVHAASGCNAQSS